MEQYLPINLTKSDSSALTRFREERGIVKPSIEDILFPPQDLRLVAGYSEHLKIVSKELESLFTQAKGSFSQYKNKAIEEARKYLETLINHTERYATPEESHKRWAGRTVHRIGGHKEPLREETIERKKIDMEFLESISKRLYQEFWLPNFHKRREELVEPYYKLSEFKTKLDTAVEEAKRAILQYFPVFQSTDAGKIAWEIVKASISSLGFGYSFESGKAQYNSESKAPSPLISLVAPEHTELLTDIVFNAIANAKKSLNEVNFVMVNQKVEQGKLPIELETRLHVYNVQAEHFHKDRYDPRVWFFFAYATATLNELKGFVEGIRQIAERIRKQDDNPVYDYLNQQIKWSNIGEVSQHWLEGAAKPHGFEYASAPEGYVFKKIIRLDKPK